MKKKLISATCLLMMFFLLNGFDLALAQVPGNTCSDAVIISPSYNYIRNTLPEGNATHSYKVYVKKTYLLAVDLINSNYVKQQIGIQIRKDGSYNGATFNCDLMQTSDCRPTPNRTKRLIFIADIEGYYTIYVQGIDGGHGPYQLRVLTAPLRTLAN
jgi:hypothetical protein